MIVVEQKITQYTINNDVVEYVSRIGGLEFFRAKYEFGEKIYVVNNGVVVCAITGAGITITNMMDL